MRPLVWALALAWAGLPLGAAAQSDTDAAAPWAPAPLKASRQLEETLSQETRDQSPTYVRGDHITGQADVRAQIDGSAELRQADTVIRADKVDYTVADDWVDAQGNVHVNRAGNVYQGSALKMHVEAFKGVFTDASYRFLDTQAHGDASQVDFLDRDRSRVHQATYTTCERNNEASWQPDWILRATSIELDRAEDVGVAKDAVLEFKGMPVLPVPSISFPLSDRRKSGLLPPTIGIDSVSGFEYSQPYYWNIAPNRDATITPTLRTKRGAGLQTEFRYLEPQYRGTLDLDLLPNDQLRNRDRWAYHWNQQSSINTPIGGLGLSWNLNRVSDDNYWRDFSRFPGETTTAVTRLLSSDANLSWGYGNHSVSLAVQKFQALQATDSTIVPPFDRMPSLHWRYAPFNTGNGLDVSFDADTTRFERSEIWNTSSTPNGQRSYALAQVSKQFLTPGSFLTPKLQLHSTQYQIDGSNTSYHRTLPTFSLDSGLVFERNTKVWGKSYIQTLEPRAFYTYTPYRDQSMLPVYDTARSDFNFASIFGENSYVGQDRIADNNLLTMGLTTRFFDPETGAERARFAIAQRMRFSDQQVVLPGEAIATKGMSDLMLGAGFNASDRWAYDSTVQYNRDSQRVVRSTISARYMPGPYKTLSAAYRFQRDASEQIDVGWQWPLFNQEKAAREQGGGRWYSVGRLNYSMKDSKLVDSVLGFEYDSCCWIGRVVLQRLQSSTTQSNTKLLFQIEFVGFSRLSLGSDPLRTLKTQVPRYRELRDEVVTPSRFSNYD